MELLSYVLAFFGLFIIINGVKPTIKWINKNSNKVLAKAIGFIAIIFTICFYLYAIAYFLISYN
mgnify:FL=1